MKKLQIFLISSIVILLTYACSTEGETITEPELTSKFNFTYNDTDYHIPPDNYSNVGITSFQDQLSMTINMINVFGGEIYFDENACAYLAPEFTKVYVDDNCTLTTLTNGDIKPIDPSNFYTYHSGEFNISLSDCETITVDLQIATYSYVSCIASGTFNLALVNQNNETIEITNGIINNFPVIKK